MAPPNVLDYLAVHELVHLVEPNHSTRFWLTVRSFCADFEKHKKWLRDRGRHETLLAEVQRLRGAVYASDSAISLSDLGSDGRHRMVCDEESWHLVLLDDHNRVVGCLRLLSHRLPTTFNHLQVRHSALATNGEWGHRVRSAVESEMRGAHARNLAYIEVGGWALSESVRGGAAALMCLAATYAWSQIIGGCFGICVATERHGSASILRRTGGCALETSGVRLPAYHDPAYGCKMELLRFDSESAGPKLRPFVVEMRHHLPDIQVIGRAETPISYGSPMEEIFSQDLQRLSFTAMPTYEAAQTASRRYTVESTMAQGKPALYSQMPRPGYAEGSHWIKANSKSDPREQEVALEAIRQSMRTNVQQSQGLC
jgi:hypothetical protein